MDDISTLMKAIDEGQISEVHRLLEAGVDANAMDEEGRSPLMAAACANDVKALDLLLQYGADDRRAYADGWTALHMAVVFQSTRLFSAEGLLGMSRLMPYAVCSPRGPTYSRRLTGEKRRLILLGRIAQIALNKYFFVADLEIIKRSVSAPPVPSIGLAVGQMNALSD